MAVVTSRPTVALTAPVPPATAGLGSAELGDGAEWPLLRHLRALGRRPDAARRAWESSLKARGLAAAREGRAHDAIRLLEQARTAIPWHDEEIEANLNELRAIRRLEKKLELRPNDPTTLLALGKAYFAQERGDVALEYFRRAAKVAPRLAEAQAMIGLELHFRGDHAGAEAAYREALRLQPGYPLAKQYLAELLRGDPPGSTLESAARSAPDAEHAAPPATLRGAGAQQFSAAG